MLPRVPGYGRYAQIEREQRWIMDGLPVKILDPVEITDRYLAGTRLRLREMKSAGEIIWKLGQKVREVDDSPEIVRITNIYLDAHEYEALADLDARVLNKTRWKWVDARRPSAIDSFHGVLEGLVLAEVELAIDDEYLAMPEGAIADVTLDNRFSGGALASLDQSGAEEFLNHERNYKHL